MAERGHDDHIGKNRLESLLKCTVSHFVHLVDTPSPSFKVRISESDVKSAMSAGSKSGCFVARWCDRSNNRKGCTSADVQLPSLPVT